MDELDLVACIISSLLADEQMPEGQMPVVQMPEGQMLNGQIPEGQMSKAFFRDQ